jgi:signal transduction histidine kinase
MALTRLTARKPLEPSTVLLISEDPEFSGAVPARWQAEARIPAFTLMTGDLCQSLDPEIFDLAIVGKLPSDVLGRVLKSIAPAGKPMIFVAGPGLEESKLPAHAIVIREQEGWLETLVLIAAQVLQRCEAVQHARLVVEVHASAEREATLGRYMLEMRHTVNNALTSLLGNTELLLLEGESLTPEARLQVETIRNMSLRIHETIQRFSSLEKELNAVAKLTRMKSQAAAGGRLAGSTSG